MPQSHVLVSVSEKLASYVNQFITFLSNHHIFRMVYGNNKVHITDFFTLHVSDDINECVTNPNICGTGYTCQNTVGSYKCSKYKYIMMYSTTDQSFVPET